MNRHTWYNTQSLTEAQKKLATERWTRKFPTITQQNLIDYCFPRIHCSHFGCPVKKQVARVHSDQIWFCRKHGKMRGLGRKQYLSQGDYYRRRLRSLFLQTPCPTLSVLSYLFRLTVRRFFGRLTGTHDGHWRY